MQIPEFCRRIITNTIRINIENTAGGLTKTPEFCRRIITNTVRTDKWERKRENKDLMRFSNWLHSRDRWGERSYSNQSIQVAINGEKYPSLYKQRAHKEKSQKLWIRIRNELKIRLEKSPRIRVYRQPGGPVNRLHDTQLSNCRCRQPWGACRQTEPQLSTCLNGC